LSGADPRLTRMLLSNPRWLRALGWLVPMVAITAALVILAIVSHWLFLTGAFGRELGRSLAIAFLDALLVAYGAAVAAAIVAAVTLAVARWGFHRPCVSALASKRAWGRLSLLCVSLWFSLALLEAGAWAWGSWRVRRPKLPDVSSEASNSALTADQKQALPSRQHPQLPTDFRGQSAELSASGSIRILVIGESSARGEPYHPVVSAGQIVAWRLKDVFPRRSVEVDMRALGGATLEMMHNKLAGLDYHPDALLLYVGHNEFAARCPWMRQFDYYCDDRPQSTVASGLDYLSAVARFSPLCRLALETRARQQVSIRPEPVVTRELIDRPAYTIEEAETIESDFERRLETIAMYCEAIATVPIFVIPPCNDAGFDPNRSILAADVPRARRVAFARSVAAARALEAKDPALALRAERELVERHPEFAELHFRIARLLEQAGQWDEARSHYIQARELDALALRCPEPLRQAYRQVAARHPVVILVDGPRVFEARSRHGIVGDQFFHDAQHPNLRGYTVLAEEILRQLAARRAFGWPAEMRAPPVDVETCARHFQMDAARWQEVCRREAWFFETTAYIRYDPRFRTERAKAYLRAAAAIDSGCDPAAAHIPGWPLPPRPASSRRIPKQVR
jgi:tetratricopeptide (TPR) repeat protein